MKQTIEQLTYQTIKPVGTAAAPVPHNNHILIANNSATKTSSSTAVWGSPWWP